MNKFEWLYQFFSFSQTTPILFTQTIFWFFFILVLTGYLLVYRNHRRRNVYLLLVSLFFYFKTSGVFLILLLFTICADFTWGLLIHKTDSRLKKKFFLSISVLINLALLTYFKYAYFFAKSISDISGEPIHYVNHFAMFTNTWFNTGFSIDRILLPVGVSFFIFQSLSYTIDIYRGKIQPVANIGDYGFFVCFFPHLVAGPIVKAHDFIHQLYKPYKVSRKEFGLAVFWIINGFGKKILADYLALNFIDRVFENPMLYSGTEMILAMFAYSMQIYMDFSGYTDMAIGLALILGFRLGVNFNSPYKAESTSDFWKRWHISLSSWLQEYLYIPLGGNRSGGIGSYFSIFILMLFFVLITGHPALVYVLLVLSCVIALMAYWMPGFKKQLNTNINILVTMLLGGLWHGSSLLFLIWGGLNGLGLIVHKYWQKVSPFKETTNWTVRFMLMLVTLTFISFTRIFFRSQDFETVSQLLDGVRFNLHLELLPKVIVGYWKIMAVMSICYLIHWIPSAIKSKYRDFFAELSWPMMAITTAILVLLVYQFMSSEMQPFIYFQF